MRVFGRIQLIPYIKFTYQISIYVKIGLTYLICQSVCNFFKRDFRK